MADEGDIASMVTETTTERAILNIRKKLNDGAPSNEFCVDCNEIIPEKRRQMISGCKRCASCQELLERSIKHYRY